ncbi:NADH-quinone oxidoreductase subunit NuoG [Chitinasiproducens palmae]|uniref:NADH-quinone oxidoreductase n=1 Tax=Chitinasiproducens palmae TaxID=1770053 RepID=A0A1H2PUF5_9BURK|nr:NADH-quinone oxidoreductase subunit NuoG [Chitinasiproducens palmae]SDV50004.1 NADH dehydrogenase subunit G [Chitinasiproducens palmae]
MVELEIDGKKVEVPEGSMVMEAAKRADTYIPHFCYHKKLTIAANCRMCLVEVEKMPKAVPACATPVSAGMIVKTRSEKAVKAQQAVMEFLLINHPLDCPICDQGGECQLQDLAVGYGKSESRYSEEKRVVFHKNVGPLLSLEEMTRCIHCTRCVRFGQEIAGVMELGMLGRGEHSEITSFVGQTVDSELSGNMIDLCPVGAITSKPFRYSARTWELSRRRSVSPHDSVGANLIVQVKNNRVMRVLPLENDAVNECWISDKDRFSYEALNSEERLTRPMIRQGGEWREVDWQTALQYVADSLNGVRAEHGDEAVGVLTSPHSTIEELFLAKSLADGLGTPNIDFRLRQADFARITRGTPWLGTSIASLDNVDRALIIGSDLRRDHPLLAARIRQAARNGARVSFINATADDALVRPATTLAAAPSAWFDTLAAVVRAVATSRGVDAPAGLPEAAVSADGANDTDNVAGKIAASLAAGERAVILLGNGVARHPDLAAIHGLAVWLAEQTGATLGFLPEAANSVGAHLIGVLPGEGGLDAGAMFAQPRKAYVLLGTEPEFDSANPAQALAALRGAELVVSLSPFKHGSDYADVLLPVAPFTETAGTFVNAEGLAQHFTGVVRPLGDTRPAWKVLRVLGNLLDLPGFDYETAEEVAKAALADVQTGERLNNAALSAVAFGGPRQLRPLADGAFERLADVPIYDADPIVRRAPSLHATQAAKRAQAVGLPTALFERLGLQQGEMVRITQDGQEIVVAARHEPELDARVVRLSAATPHAARLGALYGELRVEKA